MVSSLAYFILVLGLSLPVQAEDQDNHIIITQLPDGVTIQGGEELHQIVATWEIYVTLDPPPFPAALAQQALALNATFNKLRLLRKDDITIDLQPHYLRQQRIMERIMSKPLTQRKKRGLLDIGGSLLNALFGVATSAQLDRYNTAVKEIGSRQQAIAHAHNSLVTIVNQTRIYSEQIASRQHQLQVHVNHINTIVNNIATAISNQAKQITRIMLATDLDRFLDVLDLAADAYAAQVQLFHRQRANLELAHLTRDLLSPSQLRDIINQAASTHQTIPNLEWYYQYLSVTPLWQSTTALLYKLEIPLVSPRPYLLYDVRTHPVPISNSSYTVTLNVNQLLAINTYSAAIFLPTHCIGHLPSVCRTGPEFGSQMLQCARGLITKRRQLLAQCKVNINHYNGNTIISTIDTNKYILSSQGEVLSIRCPGLPETHKTIPKGVFNLTCNSSCIVAGNGWSVKCIAKLFIERRYSLPIVRVTSHFNFTTTVKAASIEVALPQLKLGDVRPVVGIPVGSLLSPQLLDQPYVSNKTSHMFIWLNLALIITITLIASFATLKGRRIIASIRHRIRGTQEPAIVPTSEDDHPPHTSTGIWPILPTMSACMSKSQGPPSPAAV